MTPTKPYLLRSFYEWILDNQKTPYIVVNANFPGVQVPREYVEDGKIILNISDYAVQKLKLGNERVEFVAKFSGISVPIFLPPAAVVAIYAKENGRGMVFPDNEPEHRNSEHGSETVDNGGATDDGDDGRKPPTPPTSPTGKKRGHLHVVK